MKNSLKSIIKIALILITVTMTVVLWFVGFKIYEFATPALKSVPNTLEKRVLIPNPPYPGEIWQFDYNPYTNKIYYFKLDPSGAIKIVSYDLQNAREDYNQNIGFLSKDVSTISYRLSTTKDGTVYTYQPLSNYVNVSKNGVLAESISIVNNSVLSRGAEKFLRSPPGQSDFNSAYYKNRIDSCEKMADEASSIQKIGEGPDLLIFTFGIKTKLAVIADNCLFNPQDEVTGQRLIFKSDFLDKNNQKVTQETVLYESDDELGSKHYFYHRYTENINPDGETRFDSWICFFDSCEKSRLQIFVNSGSYQIDEGKDYDFSFDIPVSRYFVTNRKSVLLLMNEGIVEFYN